MTDVAQLVTTLNHLADVVAIVGGVCAAALWVMAFGIIIRYR